MTVKTCVVYHSGYGHTAKQAEAVLEGMKGVDGVEASLVCRHEDLHGGEFGPLDGTEVGRQAGGRVYEFRFAKRRQAEHARRHRIVCGTARYGLD